MTSIEIKLTSIQDIRNFVDTVTKYGMDIDLSSGRYIVDAKSIMGIFALDITSPIKVVADTNDATSFFNSIEQFVVNE